MFKTSHPNSPWRNKITHAGNYLPNRVWREIPESPLFSILINQRQ